MPRRRRRRRDHAPGDPRNIGWLYVLPGLLVYLLFTLAPLLHTVYYSLFSWDGLTAKTWVGLANYSEAIRDHILLISFVHSAILIVFYAVIPVMLGLLLTAALTRSAIRGFRFFRTVALPAVSARRRRHRAGLDVGVRRVRAAQPGARAGRPRLARAPLARRLHLGAALDRRHRHLVHVRALHGALRGRGAEDPPRALRRRARRRRGRRARVLRGHPAGAPQRGARRVRADDDQRAAQLRHRLQHDVRRAGEQDDRAVDVHVPERVSVQPRRLRGRDRNDARARDLHPRARSCCASATGTRSDDRRPPRPGRDVPRPRRVRR